MLIEKAHNILLFEIVLTGTIIRSTFTPWPSPSRFQFSFGQGLTLKTKQTKSQLSKLRPRVGVGGLSFQTLSPERKKVSVGGSMERIAIESAQYSNC